jgi:hypothetical protein
MIHRYLLDTGIAQDIQEDRNRVRVVVHPRTGAGTTWSVPRPPTLNILNLEHQVGLPRASDAVAYTSNGLKLAARSPRPVWNSESSYVSRVLQRVR